MSEVRKEEVTVIFDKIVRHFNALGCLFEDLQATMNSTCEVPEIMYNQEQEDESEKESIR